jgi:hypothetical protein
VQAGTQRLCAWCGIAFAVLFGLGLWGIADFVPPPSPDLSPEQIADIFRSNTTSIRLGLLITLLAAPLTLPWVVVISLQLRRIEGPQAPLALIQLVSGALGVLVFVVPIMILQAAAFRPEQQDPKIIAALNDVAWLMFVGTFSIAVVQGLAIALAILRDNSPDPVFPRWLGYFNVWTVLLFLPGGLVVFFRTGPFAWNGVLAWWIPLVVFGVWFGVMFLELRKAIAGQEAAASTAGVEISSALKS